MADNRDNTIEYYNTNAEAFYSGTVSVDMSVWRDRFTAHVPAHGRILDAGCGSGRDSRAFMEQGYEVVAFDASSEMCRMASELIGQQVLEMRFEDMEFEDEFDGVWACASLLHVPYDGLPDALGRINRSLMTAGALYVSFKYGEGMKLRGERQFSDFTEETVRPLLEGAGFAIIESGITTDVRPGRDDERWVNVIARKN